MTRQDYLDKIKTEYGIDIQEFLDLFYQGMSQVGIAEHFGVSRKVIRNLGYKLGLDWGDRANSPKKKFSKEDFQSQIEPSTTLVGWQTNNNTYKKSTNTKIIEKVGFITDIHLGHHDENAIYLATDYLKDKDISTLILGGDIIDFESISFWKTLNKYSLKEELEMTKDFLTWLRFNFPKPKMYYIEANHECIEAYRTEVLTKEGWKIANNITKKDYIAQFDKETGEITFVHPNYISYHYVDKIVEIDTVQGKELVTMNHSLIVNGKRIKVKNLISTGLDRKNLRFAGYYTSSKKVYLSDDQIRLITWLIMDGTWVSFSEGKKRLQWKLSKLYKIQELIRVLRQLKIPYTIRKATLSKYNKLQPFLIQVYGKWARILYKYLKGKKQFPEKFKYLNSKQLQVLLDTISITDGRKKGNILEWSSINKANIDIIQQACIFNNIPFRYKISKDSSGFQNSKTLYIAFITMSNIKGRNAKFKIINQQSKVIAIETPKGTIITRVDGRVNFTGNSRMEKYLISNAKELAYLDNVLLPNLLELNKFRINYISNIQLLQEQKAPFKIGNLIFLHGHEVRMSWSGVNIARTMYLKTQDNVMFGHFHRTQEYMFRNISNEVRGAWAVGSLCSLSPDYSPVNNWNHGFAYIEIYSDGSFIIHNKKIINGKIL